MLAVKLARAALGPTLLAASLVASPGALANDYTDEPFETPAPERRFGLSLGVSGGVALSSVSGFPDEASKIGVAEFEASTGLVPTSGGALWIGGSPTDWLSLGIGMVGASSSGNGLSGSGGTVQVRIEAFPLFYRGGTWQDLGVLLAFGTGGYELKRGAETVGLGSGTSSVGVGAFYEPIRLWQVSMGPQLEYSLQFSDALTSHLLILGWRTAFYSGP
jgi:hypothetical protein